MPSWAQFYESCPVVGFGRSWASPLGWRRACPRLHPVRRGEGLVCRPHDVGGHDSLLVFASARGEGQGFRQVLRRFIASMPSPS